MRSIPWIVRREAGVRGATPKKENRACSNYPDCENFDTSYYPENVLANMDKRIGCAALRVTGKTISHLRIRL